MTIQLNGKTPTKIVRWYDGAEQAVKKIVVFPDGVTEKQIRPAGWTPGANTIAYYPLTQNANDYSGNNYNITTSGASSYTTDGALLPNSNHAGLLIPFTVSTSNSYTFSIWLKPLKVPSGDDMRGIDCTENTSNRLISLWDRTSKVSHWRGSSVSAKFGTDGNYTSNTRYYCTYTIDNGTIKTYINGVNLGTKTGVSGHTCALRFGQERNMGANRHWYGYMKDIIIENKVRTAQEVVDYYNLIKGDYGL